VVLTYSSLFQKKPKDYYFQHRNKMAKLSKIDTQSSGIPLSYIIDNVCILQFVKKESDCIIYYIISNGNF